MPVIGEAVHAFSWHRCDGSCRNRFVGGLCMPPAPIDSSCRSALRRCSPTRRWALHAHGGGEAAARPGLPAAASRHLRADLPTIASFLVSQDPFAGPEPIPLRQRGGTISRHRLPQQSKLVMYFGGSTRCGAGASLLRECRPFWRGPDRLYLGGQSSGAHLADVALTPDWPRDFGLPARHHQRRQVRQRHVRSDAGDSGL